MSRFQFSSRCACSNANLALLSKSLPQYVPQHASNCLENPVISLADTSAQDVNISLPNLSRETAATLRSDLSVTHPGRDSVSGTYILRRNETPFAIFKPADEELGSSLSKSATALSAVLGRNGDAFGPGDGAAREVAAYLLDAVHGNFAGVPETCFANVDLGALGVRTDEMPDVSRGSLQEFVENVGDVDDFGPSLFEVGDVQRIAAFDIRVVNCDRHGGNILVELNKEKSGKKYRLRPIDHGYILPDEIHSATWPVWMDWPQAKMPVCREVADYIEQIDFLKEKRLLSDILTETELRTLQLGTETLKKGLSEGKTLYEIGLLVFSRNPEEELTYLEELAMEKRSSPVSDEERSDTLLFDMEDDCDVPGVWQGECGTPGDLKLAAPELLETYQRVSKRYPPYKSSKTTVDLEDRFHSELDYLLYPSDAYLLPS